jgi:ArsR family metal-binding transcriptional regulator
LSKLNKIENLQQGFTRIFISLEVELSVSPDQVHVLCGEQLCISDEVATMTQKVSVTCCFPLATQKSASVLLLQLDAYRIKQAALL